MKPQQMLRAALCAIFLGLFHTTTFAERQDPAVDGYVPERIILTWADEPFRSQAVTWRTFKKAVTPRGQIALLTARPDFGKTAESANATVTEVELDGPDGQAFYYSVNFTNLLPDTRYCYRVGDALSKTWSEWNVFRTASDKPAPFKFLYMGDAQNHIKSLWPRAIRTAFAHEPNIRCIVHAGDLVQHANDDTQWADWFYSMGWIASTVPSIPTPGNHEMDDDTLSRFWRPQFRLPLNGPSNAKHLRETAYYTDLQGVRFISVDSNHYKDEDQLEWLKDVLENNTNRWTVVTHHYPVYTTGKEDDRDKPELRNAFRPLYEKYNVDLVLQGHDHSYGRTHKVFEDKPAQPRSPGVIYVVSVSGPKMYSLNPLHGPLMAKMIENTQLYQIIDVTHDRLGYEAYSIDGTLVDAFQLSKDEKGVSTYTESRPTE